MKFFYTLFLLFLSNSLLSQGRSDTSITDHLDSIVVTAYEQRRVLKDVAGAVNFLNTNTFERFNPTSIVHAVNTTPGVKMEERSPGSYRFSIRGSSLRSPFGVRNVKVYYNDIPITDPSGNTYLNSLGYYNFNSMEIIKGPGSSLYGAGTGGVLLIQGAGANERPNISTELTSGSYGLFNSYTSVTLGNAETNSKIGFQHQQSQGYRDQSALERNIFSWSGRFNTTGSSQLKTTFLYSHLFYETPGALTRNEYNANPRAARPGTGGFPGAKENKASIQLKTLLAGLSYDHHFSTLLRNTTTAYGMFTELVNPAIRNYGKNLEPHFGGRTTFSFTRPVNQGQLSLQAGGEFQQSFSTVAVNHNNRGSRDTLISLEDVPARQSLLFLQASYAHSGWELTAGGGLNFLEIRYQRSYPTPILELAKEYTNEFTPRLSLSRKLKSFTIYTSIAKGFSPPTAAELLPSGSNVNLSLEAEKGINYDLGIRGSLSNLSFDLNAFLFKLENTIVQRRDAGGGDFFTNAGKTRQRGIETAINYPFLKSASFASRSLFWISHTWHSFYYDEFKQLTTDFSGKQLPGVPAHTISTGIDVLTRNGISGNINYYYSDRIFLNDANSEFASSYHLLHAKLGYERRFGNNVLAHFTIGAENLLDQKYSLGNDINGFGGRYFNAAPGRNFYVSLAVKTFTGK